MNTNSLPLLVEPEQLEQQLGQENLRIVDLSKHETYAYGHVPHAVHLEYKEIVAARPPVMGLLPDTAGLEFIAGKIGLTPETRVVAYDDEGGGKATRLLWTLDAMGHRNLSLLNGGIHAWVNEGRPLEQKPNTPAATQYSITHNESVVANRGYIQQHLHDAGVVLLDARSPEEYTGQKKFSARGGHIPGAVNLDWVHFIDQRNNLRLKPEQTLNQLLTDQGITPDKTIVAYCQTNHRSALVYYALKALGYLNIKAYPGSWSEWGNLNDTPIE
jgi:thiosulfate/3-mercaptopyruvate sulfurtransferase